MEANEHTSAAAPLLSSARSSLNKTLSENAARSHCCRPRCAVLKHVCATQHAQYCGGGGVFLLITVPSQGRADTGGCIAFEGTLPFNVAAANGKKIDKGIVCTENSSQSVEKEICICKTCAP